MRSLVRSAAAKATTDGVTIADVLATKSIALAAKIEDGSGGQIAGATGNGTSVQYQAGVQTERVGITAQIEAIEKLLDLHSLCTVSPYVVATVREAMLDKLVACRTYRTNFHSRSY